MKRSLIASLIVSVTALTFGASSFAQAPTGSMEKPKATAKAKKSTAKKAPPKAKKDSALKKAEAKKSM